MRKRNFDNCIDKIFWYIIYALPFLWYGISFLSKTYTPVSMSDFFAFVGFDVTGSITFTTLSDLFGASGVLPLFANPVVIQLFSWFINCFIIHLAVDFLLFIPRIAHRFMAKVTIED